MALCEEFASAKSFTGRVIKLERSVKYQLMPSGIKVGTIFTAISLSLSSVAPALAQTSIQSLPNGNYRFCSNPPPSSIVSDLEVLAAGHCFVFRKTGNRVVGDFVDMSAYGEINVCAVGTVSGNTIKGEALENLLPEDRPLPVERKFQGITPRNWDNNGYLKVARASATYVQSEDYVLTSIRYRTALLNLDGFHRYNAGTRTPPTSCQR